MTARAPRRDVRLGEHGRQRVFALAAAILAAAWVGLSLLDRPARETTAHPTTTPSHNQGPRPAVATQATELASPGPAASSRRSQARRPDRRLRATAVRFLRGYLPYLYGQARLRAVKASSPALRRRLARDRRRVPPAARRRRPRVRALRLGGLVRDVGAWRVTARISDGDIAVYPIELLIAERGGRFVVIGTGGE